MITDKTAPSIGLPLIGKGIALLTAICVIAFIPASSLAFEVRLGTGEAGTFSHFTGRIITRLINMNTEAIHFQLVPASGDMHNLTNLNEGSLDLAVVDSRMLYDAVTKAGNFQFLDIRYENLRSLIPLYDMPIVLVTRNDAHIDSLGQLSGKRLNIGPPRSLQQMTVDAIMSAKGWSEKDFGLITEISPSLSQDTMAFCHGTVQAMVHIGVHPDSSLQQLLQRCGGGLLGLNDKAMRQFVSQNPAYAMMKIPAGLYHSNKKGLETMGTKAILVASGDLDSQSVHQILALIYSNKERLHQAHPALQHISVSAGSQYDVGVEPHPGAVQYFSEN
jgi:TRAP transporter TAXI family solute receptor